MNILVINAGSSSLKFQLFDMKKEQVLAKGAVERIALGAFIVYTGSGEKIKMETSVETHEEAVRLVIDALTDPQTGVISSLDDIDAVGHRFAHGGKYGQSVLIDDEVMEYSYSVQKLAPLHTPPILKGVEACRKLMPDIPQAAVFDTAFYTGMEDYVYVYPLPYELYERYGIRKYGFHGTSHRYVAQKAAEYAGKDVSELKIVSCHLGNGSSVTAVKNGKAVDTTMGFTPLDGLIMGTRSGAIDPAIITYLINEEGFDPKEVNDIIYKKSGFLGVSGVSSDCRDIELAAASGNKRAQLALNILNYEIKKYIGAYTAAMNGIDILIFTAGMGERGPEIREKVCRDFEFFGIEIDEKRNAANEFDITKDGARTKTLVVPTNEEYMIAFDTLGLVEKA